MALYDLKNDFDAKRAIKYLKRLFKDKSKIDLSKVEYRSSQQNRYLHLIIGWLAIETGNTLDYTKKEYYKRLCNSDLFIVSLFDNLLKKDVKYLRSTADLTKEEMTLSIERFRNWSSEQGFYLPSANETDFLSHIDFEMRKQKEYL